METHEIVDKLESIVTETLPEATGRKWENQSVSDLVVKYKVRVPLLVFIAKFSYLTNNLIQCQYTSVTILMF